MQMLAKARIKCVIRAFYVFFLVRFLLQYICRVLEAPSQGYWLICINHETNKSSAIFSKCLVVNVSYQDLSVVGKISGIGKHPSKKFLTTSGLVSAFAGFIINFDPTELSGFSKSEYLCYRVSHTACCYSHANWITLCFSCLFQFKKNKRKTWKLMFIFENTYVTT